MNQNNHNFKTHLALSFATASGMQVRDFQMVSTLNGKAYATACFYDGKLERHHRAEGCDVEADRFLTETFNAVKE